MTFEALDNLVPIPCPCLGSLQDTDLLRSRSLFKKYMNVPRLCLCCSPPLMPFPQLLHCSLPAAHLPVFAVARSALLAHQAARSPCPGWPASVTHAAHTGRCSILRSPHLSLDCGVWSTPVFCWTFLSPPDSLPWGQSVNGLPALGRNPLSKLLLQSHCPSWK